MCAVILNRELELTSRQVAFYLILTVGVCLVNRLQTVIYVRRFASI